MNAKYDPDREMYQCENCDTYYENEEDAERCCEIL